MIVDHKEMKSLSVLMYDINCATRSRCQMETFFLLIDPDLVSLIATCLSLSPKLISKRITIQFPNIIGNEVDLSAQF